MPDAAAPEGPLVLRASHIGAEPGESLRGLRSLAGLELEVVTGYVMHLHADQAAAGPEALRDAIAAAHSMSADNADARLRRSKPLTDGRGAATLPTHQPVGSKCSHAVNRHCTTCDSTATFKLRGLCDSMVKQANALGTATELRQLMESGRAVTSAEILRLVVPLGGTGGAEMCLRPRLLQVVPRRAALGPADAEVQAAQAAGALLDGTALAPAAPAAYYKVQTRDGPLFVKVPAPVEHKPTRLRAPAHGADYRDYGAMRRLVRRATQTEDARHPEWAISDADLDTLLRLFARATHNRVGLLKSLVQKHARRGPGTLDLAQLAWAWPAAAADTRAAAAPAPAPPPAGTPPPPGPPLLQPLWRTMAVALVVHFAHRPQFAPAAGKMKEEEEITKRLAVTMAEDACSKNALADLEPLIAVALAASAAPGYAACDELVVGVVKAGLRVLRAKGRFAWDAHKHRTQPGLRTKLQQLPPQSAAGFARAAAGLKTLGSFQSDVDMFYRLAAEARPAPAGPDAAAPGPAAVKLFCTTNAGREALQRDLQPLTVAWAVDQHVMAPVAYFLADDCFLPDPALYSERDRAAPGFAQPAFRHAMARIFGNATGRNVRMADFPAPADFRGPFLAQLARAQAWTLDCMLGRPRPALPAGPTRTLGTLRLDPSTLATGTREFRVKVTVDGAREALVVTLGLRVPERMNVVREPTRSPEPLREVSDEARAKAVQAAQAMAATGARRLASPLLDAASGGQARLHVRFCAEAQRWTLDGRPWADWLAEGLPVTAALAPDPSWLVAGKVPRLDDDTLYESLAATGTGAVRDLDAAAAALVAHFPAPVVQRALGFMKHEHAHLRLPVPARTGGPRADGDFPYGDVDPAAWRLLVHLARLAPGALAVAAPPHFAVKDARLLRFLERTVERTRPDPDGAAQTRRDWSEHPAWKPAVARARARLKPHQRDALREAQAAYDETPDAEAPAGAGAGAGPAAARPTAMLCYMPPGSGKTVWALLQAHWVLARQGCARAILWVAPENALESLHHDIATTWGVPCVRHPKVSRARKCPRGCVPALQPLAPLTVTLLGEDTLRLVVDQLAAQCKHVAVVFDEFDRVMASETQRTAAALRVLAVCPFAIGMSGTLKADVSRMLPWLKAAINSPVPYPLVGVAAMVMKRIDLGIRWIHRTERLPLPEPVREALLTLHATQDWHGMETLVRRHSEQGVLHHAAAWAAKGHRVFLACPTKQAVLSRAAALQAAGLRVVTRENAKDAPPDTQVWLMSGRENRGTNFAVACDVLLDPVLLEGSEERVQRRGRLMRIGQTAAQLHHVTVVMENTPLAILHERHCADDSKTQSMAQLGKLYDHRILQALQPKRARDADADGAGAGAGAGAGPAKRARDADAAAGPGPGPAKRAGDAPAGPGPAKRARDAPAADRAPQ
jgi:hypothetical protein